MHANAHANAGMHEHANANEAAAAAYGTCWLLLLLGDIIAQKHLVTSMKYSDQNSGIIAQKH